MRISVEQLKDIQKKLAILSKDGIVFADDGYLSEEEYDEIPDDLVIDDIGLEFPDDMDYCHYTVEDFMRYMTEYRSIKRVDRKTVKTKHCLQTVISSSRIGFYAFQDRLTAFTFSGNGINARVVSDPFLIGVMNAREHLYDEDFGTGACEPYWAIEVNSMDEIDLKRAEDLVERICFFLTFKLGVEIYPSEVFDFSQYYEEMDELYVDDDEAESEESVIDISSLPHNNPLHKLYRQARGIENAQIRFLQYYKVIEQVSIQVAKVAAFGNLMNKIDGLPDVLTDSDLLNPFLAILRDYDTRIEDDTLASSVIENCIEVVKLYELLPARLRKMINANFKSRNTPLIEGSFTDDQVLSLCKQIGAMLYSTRNRIVHAKANYITKNNEIRDDELDVANELMDTLCRSIIRWNLKQPEGFRL